MLTVYKYELQLGRTELELPQGAEVLCVQTQGAEICLWAKVDTDKFDETRIFHIFGTGHSITTNSRYNYVYLATVQQNQGDYVWHVFELT